MSFTLSDRYREICEKADLIRSEISSIEDGPIKDDLVLELGYMDVVMKMLLDIINTKGDLDYDEYFKHKKIVPLISSHKKLEI